ncbi:MAG: hypothetical protein IKN89_07145 [Oscillospiraceae bacterium]|nr:hypothetical protein [Oscillospiraceae bacterium]
MIGVLSEWVRSLAVGAVFCGAVLLLAPEGKEKRAVKLTCAMMLTILLISPLRRLDARQLTELLTLQRMEENRVVEDADELSMEICSRIIREETEEYIWDAAQRLGIGKLGIRLRLKETRGLPCPWSIELTGSVTASQKEKLALLLEGELGIPEERQTWSVDDAG